MSFRFDFIVKCDNAACKREMHVVASNPDEANEKLEKEGWTIRDGRSPQDIRHICPGHGKPRDRA